MKNYLLLILLISSLKMNSQSLAWRWAKVTGENVADQGTFNDMATDSYGNMFVVGSFSSSTITFGSTTLVNSGTNQDLFIVKYSPEGNAIWASSTMRSYISNANLASIALDSLDNCYIMGHFVDSITFGNTTLFADSIFDNDIFIVKYSPTGNIIWAKTYQAGEKFSVDKYGFLYLTGYFQEDTLTIGNYKLFNTDTLYQSFDVFTAKLDTLGNPLWVKKAEGISSELPTAINVDIFGNTTIVGHFGSPTISFDNFVLNSNGNFDIFVTKYDTIGNVLWAKGFGSTFIDGGGGSIGSDNNGNCYVTGVYRGTGITFGTTILANAGQQNIFFTKFDLSGNIVWAKRVSGGFSLSGANVTTDEIGNSYLVGNFPSSVISLDTFSITNGGQENFFIAKYNSIGNVEWVKKGGSTGYDFVNEVNRDIYNNIYLIGGFNSPTLSFGNTTFINPDSTGSNTNHFIVKLAKDQVWPGDSNNDLIVNNNDLLPIGLHFGQVGGVPRDSISNLWQSNSALNWNLEQTNGYDLKHADCNGDGIINDDDTLAIDLNFSLIHTISPSFEFNNERQTAAPIYFVTENNTYQAGDWVDVELWLGTSTAPVNDIYGIAFDINYTSSLVESNTETIDYPTSWLGTPGINSIKIHKIDPLSSTAYGAIVRTNHINVSGFGKIADFKFQIKNSILSNSTMNFSISNYKAVDSSGTNVLLSSQNQSVLISPTSTGITKINNSIVTVFPNPSDGSFVFSNLKVDDKIEVFDIAGRLIYQTNTKGVDCILNLSGKEKGIYFYKILNFNKVEQGTIILQ